MGNLEDFDFASLGAMVKSSVFGRKRRLMTLISMSSESIKFIFDILKPLFCLVSKYIVFANPIFVQILSMSSF